MRSLKYRLKALPHKSYTSYLRHNLRLQHQNTDYLVVFEEISKATLKAVNHTQVLETILVHLKPLLHYHTAYLFKIDSQSSPLLIFSTPSDQEYETEISIQKKYSNLINSVITQNKAIITSNIVEDFDSNPTTGQVTAGIPLKFLGEVNGVVILEAIETRYYQVNIAKSEPILQYAALILHDLRISDSLQKRSKEAETLRQAAAVITSEIDLDHVLDRILVNLKKVVQYDNAALYLLEGDQLVNVASSLGEGAGEIFKHTIPADTPLFMRSLISGKALILPDAALDPDFTQGFGEHTIHAWMGIPLQLRGRVTGFLIMECNQLGAFDEFEALLALAFANQATIALENARLFKELHELAINDPLTGIWNRRHFIQQAKLEFRRAKRYRQALSVILFDLDDFKSINDTFGHAVGDEVLHAVAQICQENLRKVDLFGRYGGEEFMALLPNTDLESAKHVAERLRGYISAHGISSEKGLVRVSASFGVASIDDSCPDIYTLLNRADRASYASKREGKNMVSVPEELYEN